jgi:hypothetical protein
MAPALPPCVPHPVPPSTTVHHLRLHSLLTTSLSTDFEQDVNMSESSSDLEPIHAAHLPDRAFSLMTIPLDGLRSAIDCANGSLRTINGPSYSAPPTSHHFSVPSRRHANQTPTWTMMSMAGSWVFPQSLSTVGALRHPISATLAHLSIPLAVSRTPHGEPNTISHFRTIFRSLFENQTFAGGQEICLLSPH